MLETQRKRTRNHYNLMTLHADAFLETLKKHCDTPVTRTDLLEDHPELEWTGMIAQTWALLLKQKELENRLISAGRGSEIFYSLLSQENDTTILESRLDYLIDYYEKDSVQDKFLDVWHRRKKALAAVVGAAGGIALSVYMVKRQKGN